MSIISKVENLVFREYDDTTIIYNLKLKNYVITNSVGSDIWQFICNTHLTYIDSNDIINHICSIYDENPKHIGTDIEQFIIELYDANIIYVDGKRNTEKIPELSSPSERDIEGEIIEIMRAKNQIYSATFELTYECNEKCVHCYATYTEDTPKKKVLTLEKCKELIDELYEIKCFHLVFTGGDPFVFDGFMELLEYAHKKQFTFDVYTNALEIFHHPEYISQIQKLYPRTFYISLYGSTAETHETITQIKGSFTKTIRAIKMLRAADIAVVLNVMMMKPNYQD
jgi:sulfatase maturation enzyme AslB (radical SAM superfamily)